MEGLPKTIEDLADKNKLKLREHDISTDGLSESSDASYAASADFIRNELSGRMYKYFSGEKGPDELNDREELSPEKRQLARELVETGNISMLLIRPEMQHHTNCFEAYLKESKFDILLKTEKKLGVKEYEQMYGHAIAEPSARDAMPTRTMVYLDAPCTMLLFTDTHKQATDEEPLADRVIRKHKGKQGIPDEATLRGSVVYREAKRLGFDTLSCEVVGQALDPMHTYRHIIAKEDQNAPHAHLSPADRLLQYTGVGVHIPTNKEIARDMMTLCTENELKEALFGIKHPHITEYNSLWQENAPGIKPLLFLIGGYAGTGKSRLAQKVREHIPFMNTVPTGILREIAKQEIDTQTNPFLYSNTYKLGSVKDPNDEGLPLTEKYRKQVEPTAKLLKNIVSFASTEKQHWILEGNHILPEFLKDITDKYNDVIVVEAYTKVSDPAIHEIMMGGPTHRRVLEPEERIAARELHDFIVQQATESGKNIYEFNESEDLLMKQTDEMLKKYLEEYYKQKND